VTLSCSWTAYQQSSQT